MNYLDLTDEYFSDFSHARAVGRISAVNGILVECEGLAVKYGEIVEINPGLGFETIAAEVVGISRGKVLLMPYGSVEGIALDGLVMPTGKFPSIKVSGNLKGRVIDPLGRPLDGLNALTEGVEIPVYGKAINPLSRSTIKKPFTTGVKLIDVLTPLGEGQRIGIFAGSGVGKSTLLSMIANFSNTDVIVIAMIGERGREVGDFIEQTLGLEKKKAVVVVATAGEPAVVRRKAAFTATAIAEYFRDLGKSVLLVMDSITRFAMAQREIGLATGESLGARGYPASVFAHLPPLIERGGAIKNSGSITAIYTVLVEGDDINEPISDSMRSILDGHIYLSRDLASSGIYPCIDVPNSLSRLASSVLQNDQILISNKLREYISLYEKSKDLIELGLYKAGSNGKLDAFISQYENYLLFSKQRPQSGASADESWKMARKLVESLNG